VKRIDSFLQDLGPDSRIKFARFGFSRRLFPGLVIALATLLLPPAGPLLAAPLGQAVPACTYTIPKEVGKVDGLTNYAQVKPGDTLCLPAGTRGPIKFFNLHGVADQPITIRNAGGGVKITGTSYNEGVSIRYSSYLRLTGTGVSSQCGAEYPAGQQACGIELDRTNKGIVLAKATTAVHHIEIDHIFIHDTSTTINSRAIVIHPLDRVIISGFSAHHNYIRNTRGEGMYIGSEPHGKPFADLGKLKNVELSYNLVEQTGYDGIKVKAAIEDVKVHHNLVIGAGFRNVSNHKSGIHLATSLGEIYNNWVMVPYEGIKSGRPLENPGSRYFNNVVVGSQKGILTEESNALIYNNTIVGTTSSAIKSTGSQTLTFDNIIAGASGTVIQGQAANIFNNLIASVAASGFANPAQNDYHLLPSSPAVNAGRNSGIFPPFDFDDLSRPQGPKTDQGAFELPVPANNEPVGDGEPAGEGQGNGEAGSNLPPSYRLFLPLTSR
jgi:hypothetical protein